MSLFRALDRTPAVSCFPFLASPCPFLYPSIAKRCFSKRSERNTIAKRMDNVFIGALVRATLCSEHAKPPLTLSRSFSNSNHKPRPKDVGLQKTPRRRKNGPLKAAKQFAENELKALVDYYNIELAEEPGFAEPDEFVDDGPLVWNVGDDHQPWPLKNPEDAATITKLADLIQDEDSPHDTIFETYRQLPAPRVVYLEAKTIRAMLHHLSVVERPTRKAMQRFLSILDDMKKAHIHITRAEWTTATYFAGRFRGFVSGDEVHSALTMWRDMEKRAQIRGGLVTFNVLFDIAVKAGKYQLAESFLQEMRARGIPIHRHFRVSLIYYYGTLKNGNAIRKVYRDLVEAKDVVDTVVMNAVIAALMRAGEPAAAEQVFARMKRLHSMRSVPFPGQSGFDNRRWRDQRRLGLHLTYDARRIRAGDDPLVEYRELQDWAPMMPNSRTYSILIRHHAHVSGNLVRVEELIREMGYRRLPLEGTIFIVMFFGFAEHGGGSYTAWTRQKLEQTWSEYLNAVQIGLDRTWFSAMAVIAALKAFRKCTNTARTLSVWQEAKEAWKPSEREEALVLEALGKLVPPG